MAIDNQMRDAIVREIVQRAISGGGANVIGSNLMGMPLEYYDPKDHSPTSSFTANPDMTPGAAVGAISIGPISPSDVDVTSPSINAPSTSPFGGFGQTSFAALTSPTEGWSNPVDKSMMLGDPHPSSNLPPGDYDIDMHSPNMPSPPDLPDVNEPADPSDQSAVTPSGDFASFGGIDFGGLGGGGLGMGGGGLGAVGGTEGVGGQGAGTGDPSGGSVG